MSNAILCSSPTKSKAFLKPVAKLKESLQPTSVSLETGTACTGPVVLEPAGRPMAAGALEALGLHFEGSGDTLVHAGHAGEIKIMVFL